MRVIIQVKDSEHFTIGRLENGFTITSKQACTFEVQDTQPTAQPKVETCKWNRCVNCRAFRSPHDGIERSQLYIEMYPRCPTCGKRIEVVE